MTAPLALLGPRTGTNNTVSSGAHFGVTGRLVGSGLTLAFALAYAAIAVWTSGDALVGAAHRLVGTPTRRRRAGDRLRADRGRDRGRRALRARHRRRAAEDRRAGRRRAAAARHPRLRRRLRRRPRRRRLRARRLLADVDARGHRRRRRPALLRAEPRRLHAPDLAPPRRPPRAARRGRRHLLGLLATTLFGAFTAVTFTDLGDSYVADLVAGAPGWYVLPILVIGLAGGVGQGVLNLYASGLDLEALVPRLRRVHTTLITSVAAVVLLYAGTFALDAVDSITAMTLVLNGVAAPWVVVNLVGFLVARRGRYDPDDLQAFNQGRRGGRYWFTGGWNLRALVAWAAGSAFGLLAVTDRALHRPAREPRRRRRPQPRSAPALVAGAVYLTALAIWPGRRDSHDRSTDPLGRLRREARLRRPDVVRRPALHRGRRRARGRRRGDRRRADGRADLRRARHPLRAAGDPRRELRRRRAPRGRRRRAARGPAGRRLRRRADPPRRPGALARGDRGRRSRRCSRRARCRSCSAATTRSPSRTSAPARPSTGRSG